MARVCLPKMAADTFKNHLKSGAINPEKLTNMSSKERQAFFSKIVGETNSKNVNALFESKLLLKNQQAGMIRWAEQVSGITPEIKNDIITKINSLTEILTPASEKAFLADLAEKRLGVQVTSTEAKTIATLAKQVQDAKNNITDFKSQVNYGREYIKFLDYMQTINPEKNSHILSTINIPRITSTVGDLGWGFRQGWGMVSRPELWKGLAKQFSYFKKGNYDTLRAEIISDPDYQILKSKLRLPALTEKLSGKEEEFMSSFIKKVPGLAQLEQSQQGLASYVRFNVAKKMLEAARLTGEDVSKNSKVVQDITNSVNGFSGSGNIGINDKYANLAPVLNSTFFSARKASGSLYMMNPYNYFGPTISKTVRINNMRNLIGSLAMTAGALQLANLFGAQTTSDPLSSNFGKFVVGNHHVDLTGGNGSYAVLLSRFMMNKRTSDSGKNIQFDKGYKPETRGTLIANFSRNKLAPLASVVADKLFGPIPTHDPALAKVMFGQPAKGNPFDLKREAMGSTVPMITNTIIETMQQDPRVIPILLDYFGNSDQVY